MALNLMSSSSDSIVIASARRTAIGSFQGAFATQGATQLGAAAIRSAVEDSGLEAATIDAAYVGCVLTGGLGQAPARQAVLGAGLPQALPCTLVSKVCGSGLKAVMLGADAIRAGSAERVIAAGMESMSRTPYLLARARSGYRMGHGELIDHMFLDGLQDAYSGQLMGQAAEHCAQQLGISRAVQDEYAQQSVLRAQRAVADGSFVDEICPVIVVDRQASRTVIVDETPGRCEPAKIATLPAAFDRRAGTITAASSASISDGAAAVVMLRESDALKQGVKPLARLVAQAEFAGDPQWFTTAPITAIQTLLARCGWDPTTVDLFEINEAFALVAILAIQQLGLNAGRVNVNGGACALGHPIGASGTRILVTLIHALRRRGLRRGIAAICIGGGEAVAVAVEMY